MQRRSLGRRLAVAAVALVLIWAGIDLLAPRSTDIRRFDAGDVARLETAMWRSYYSRERLRLFVQLAELLRTQYHLPLLSSNVAAYQATRAAFTFKGGSNRVEYERALPNLVSFYKAIRRVSNVPFDVDRAARLELEWWIVHRERSPHQGAAELELVRALGELQAEIYRVPVEQVAEHARLRAKAMTIRDAKALGGEVLEDDWLENEARLLASWQALSRAVHGEGTAR